MADTSFSIVVTHRDVDGFRERNLAMVLCHMSGLSGAEVIVVEQDRRPRLRLGDCGIAVRQCFAYNPGLFNKSWGLNVGVRMARAPVLLLLDGDILLETEAVQAAVDACRHGVSAVNPYNELIDLSADDSDAVCDGRRNLEQVHRHRSNRSWVKENPCFCGGAYFMDAEFYREIGGQDERFEGWGGEDDAMSLKTVCLAQRTMTLADAHAYHLYHPRRRVDVYDTASYLSNKALLEAYAGMSAEEMRRLGKTQWDQTGDREKYRER